MKRMEDAAKRLYKKYGAAFLVGVLCGLWAYAVIVFGFVTIHDSIGFFPVQIGKTISLGRWFLEVIRRAVALLGMDVTVPAFNGVLAVALLALSGCVASETLGLRGRVFPVLVTTLFVVFPAMGAAMLYIYTAHAYALAVLLAVLGAYATAKRPGLFGLSTVCYALSMGIYQAYIPLAMSLLMLVVLRRCFSGEQAGRTVGFAAACLASFLLGYLLYRAGVALSLRLTGEQLENYMGVSQMGAFAGNLPEILRKIYAEVRALPSNRLYGVAITRLVQTALRALYALSAAVFLWLLVAAKPKGGALSKAIACAVMAAFPLGVHFIVLMCNGGYAHSLMTYALVCLFILPAVLLDMARAQAGAAGATGGRRALAVRAASLVAALCMAASACCYIWQNNGVAMMMSVSDQQAMHYFSELRTRIRSTPGYRPDARLAVIGEGFDDATQRNRLVEETRFDEQFSFVNLIDYYSKWKWMSYALGFEQPEASEEELREIEQLERVREMPCYPADGSIAMIGEDVIVLKLSGGD